MKFSGHESFHCRSLWLKKGYDHLKSGYDFKDDAPILLGVGKNMVSSIRYWVKSFGLVDTESEELKLIADRIFGEDGWDPFLEDEGTLWLLHYWVVTQGYASIYGIIFNELRKRKPLFTTDNFVDLVKELGDNTSESSLRKDFQALTRTYVSKNNDKDLEDSYSGILTELKLVKEHKIGLEIEPIKRPNIPLSILLYCILDNHKDSNSLSFESLYGDNNSVGSVFALSREGLNDLLEGISEEFKDITYSNEAGIREIQFKKKIDSLNTLKEYYEN
ncbi:DUF4007 family protein [Fulvivirgaceae bacterium BMA12]|uniref:DUF4007 family protein n=1 Tax=Agaribacillus aureus TaxID=3051825 RepID=A0ABT8L878_9BACT|nr:DUF4007 family protein [Fulvivirgaceae bacterium BMA12]